MPIAVIPTGSGSKRIPLKNIRWISLTSMKCTPIRVAFFDDLIDIESPGLLLPGMTIEDMKSGISRIRNPVIARVFRELRLIEQWGSGFRRIFDDAARQGLPEPLIEEIATGLRVRIRLARHHDPSLPSVDNP